MINNSPKFYENPNYEKGRLLKSSILDKSIELYDEKKYKEAFSSLLNFVDSDMCKKFEAGQTHWEMPHGSCVVRFDIKEDGLRIGASVSKLSDTSYLIPLKRKLCEINFSNLDLANVAVINGEIIFYYDFLWGESHPRKVYDVLWDICHFTDRFDDEFVEKFKTEYSSKPQVNQLPSTEKEKLYDRIQEDIRSTKKYFEKFQSDRNETLMFYSVIVSIMKIEYFASLQSFYKTEFEDIISYAESDTSDSLTQITSNCMHFLNDLENPDNKTKVLECMYEVKLLVPERAYSPLSVVRDTWERSYANITRAFDGNDLVYVTFSALQAFYKLISYYNVPQDIYNSIVTTLRKVSEKPYEESAAMLKDTMTSILNNNIKSASKSRKGFFKRLFNI
ncbi:MAG: hypothetical protein ACK5L5_00790 [Bacteroidales bacterium]